MDLISLVVEISIAQKAIAIFVFTLILAIWQPRGLGIGFSALAGAILALVSGVVTWQNVFDVWVIAGNATLTFISLIIISLILNEAGFFRWVALHLIKWGDRKGLLLWVLVVLIAVAITAVLSNYATALIWIPIVLEITLALGFPAKAIIAFIMAIGFIADATSLALPVSNLTNIISTDYLQISFWRYTLVMLPVNFMVIVVSVGVLWFYFQRYIPPNYNQKPTEDPSSAIRDRVICRWGFVILGFMLVGYFIATRLGLPVGLVAGVTAWMMLFLATKLFEINQKPVINIGKILLAVPWQIIIFILGIDLLVIGLRSTELTSFISNNIEYFSHWGITLAATGTAIMASLLSSVMNHLSTVLINSIAIKDVIYKINDPIIREVIIYANIIGCNLGAKITPIGSFATLLWLHFLANKKIHITWREYARTSIVLTIPVLFVALLSLAIWIPWLVVSS